MTTAPQSDEKEPRPSIHDPEEALRRARPLPPRERIEVKGVSPEEWEAFREAISRS